MEDIKKEFEKYDNSTPLLSLSGIETYARVVDVHDGDTLKLIIKFKNDYYKFISRIDGIDTCEIHSKIPKLKQKALEARDKIMNTICKTNNITDIKSFLQDNIIIVRVKCFNFDKYGRLLTDIFSFEDNISVKNILLSNKLAYSYDGKTKMSDEDQIKYFY